MNKYFLLLMSLLLVSCGGFTDTIVLPTYPVSVNGTLVEGNQTLQEVTVLGNTTTESVVLDSDGDGLTSVGGFLGVGTFFPTVTFEVLGSSILNGTVNMVDNPITNVNYIDFDLVNGVPAAEGRMVWNDVEGTVNLGLRGGTVNLQVGQEIVDRAKNTEPVTINNGNVVFISGGVGGNSEIQMPIASNVSEAPKTYAVATESVGSNQFGYGTLVGKVRDIDTTGSPVGEVWVAGDVLYLSATTEGELTKVRPTPPNTGVIVGVVLRAHATQGVLGVNPVVIQRLNLASDVIVSALEDNDFLYWDSDTSVWRNKQISFNAPLSFEIYDAQPSRASESNIHGGLVALATGQPLNSVPTNISVNKGIGKLMISVNAGSDVVGSITIKGASVDRDTGVTTPNDSELLSVDSLTIDNSDVDGNGNTRHSFSNAYISSKWYVGTVNLSTTDLTLSDVDVYHLSFEQFNDKPDITLDTFDINLLTTNVNAEFDAYLYTIEVESGKAFVNRTSSLNVGTDGETAIANKYWRLRRANIDKHLDGSTDGVWVDIHYSNSPSYVEDVSMKVWASETITVT